MTNIDWIKKEHNKKYKMEYIGVSDTPGKYVMRFSVDDNADMTYVVELTCKEIALCKRHPDYALTYISTTALGIDFYEIYVMFNTYFDYGREWSDKHEIHSKLSLTEFICRSHAKKLYFTITDLDLYSDFDVDNLDIDPHCIREAYDFKNKCIMEKVIGVNIIIPSTHIHRGDFGYLLWTLRSEGTKFHQLMKDFYDKKWGVE